jgi:hypothetical protein
MLQAWTKAAALKTNTDAIRSAVELNPTVVPQFEDKSASQTFCDITDAFTVQDQDHDKFIDTLLKSIFPLVRQEPDKTVAPTTEQPPPPLARAETQQPQATRAPSPPDSDSDEVQDVTPPGANRDIPHQPLTRPHARVDHQQLDQRRHDDYRENLRNKYYDEQQNKRHPPSLSPTSKQPRGRTAVHWDNKRTNDNLTWPTLDRHDAHFDSQYRRQHTTRDHTQTKGNSWNNNTSYGTPRNAWNTQALHTPTPRNTDQHNSWRATSNPFSTNATNQSTDNYYPFDQVNATPASIKLKNLTDIASIRPLSTQEWNQWNVLNATIPKINKLKYNI